MFFPISGAHISPTYLVIIGFVIGILGGFFGVGGSFIAGPALRAVGLDWNFAVGTDLAHIVGKSVVAVRQHRAFGNVDLRLGLFMAVGTIGGAEVGAQLIQMLKRAGNVNLVVSIVSIAVYVSISTFMIWESRKTLAAKAPLPPATASGTKKDIRMPSMVYVLGIPTHLAVGTDLFEIIISASYGTFSHAIKGNVDILIALVMHTGAAIGAQIGAISTQYFAGPKIRLAFVPLPLIGAAIVIYTLMTGHKL